MNAPCSGAPLTAPHVTTGGLCRWKAINKVGRHVGLDFYDLLIEGHSTQNPLSERYGDFSPSTASYPNHPVLPVTVVWYAEAQIRGNSSTALRSRMPLGLLSVSWALSVVLFQCCCSYFQLSFQLGNLVFVRLRLCACSDKHKL